MLVLRCSFKEGEREIFINIGACDSGPKHMLQHCQLFIPHVEHTALAHYYLWYYGLIIASVYTINQNNKMCCTHQNPLFNFNDVLNCNFLFRDFDRWKKKRLSKRQLSYSSHPKSKWSGQGEVMTCSEIHN